MLFSAGRLVEDSWLQLTRILLGYPAIDGYRSRGFRLDSGDLAEGTSAMFVKRTVVPDLFDKRAATWSNIPKMAGSGGKRRQNNCGVYLSGRETGTGLSPIYNWTFLSPPRGGKIQIFFLLLLFFFQPWIVLYPA
jgi:hypothetical protein